VSCFSKGDAGEHKTQDIRHILNCPKYWMHTLECPNGQADYVIGEEGLHGRTGLYYTCNYIDENLRAALNSNTLCDSVVAECCILCWYMNSSACVTITLCGVVAECCRLIHEQQRLCHHPLPSLGTGAIIRPR
jgi:hypothetical protein